MERCIQSMHYRYKMKLQVSGRGYCECGLLGAQQKLSYLCRVKFTIHVFFNLTGQSL